EPYIYHEFDEDFVGSPITVLVTGFLRSEAAFSSFGERSGRDEASQVAL
ncbi:riboflavin kinase, partial [Toxoplasma gondii GT1]